MAERRMFAKTIVLSDAFLDMPLGARCLYMTMGMLADDDGFVNAPKSIMRQCGCSEDDLKMLIAKRFVIPFETGIIVIKHWRINNYLQRDRLTPTKYQDELGTLQVDENGAYTQSCIHDGDVPCIHSIDKYSIEENSINKNNIFVAPTLEEVEAYCQERNNSVDPQKFIDYYTSNGWRVGRNKMKDWQAAIRTWEKNSYDQKRDNGHDKTSPSKWNLEYAN